MGWSYGLGWRLVDGALGFDHDDRLRCPIVWLFRAGPSGGSQSTQGGHDVLSSAKRILAERYARGELSTDEYRERVDQLG